MFSSRDIILKIIFRNLARHTTQEALLALFQKHGRVQSCTIVMDPVSGSSKGFGFVNMPVPGEAKAAIRALNGLQLDGSRIRVKKAVDTPKPASPASDESQGVEMAAELDTGSQAATDKARTKKDGTVLGPRKARTFRKKQDD